LLGWGYYFTFLLDQKGKKKSRQNDASAHRPLRRPAVLPGLAFLILRGILWAEMIFYAVELKKALPKFREGFLINVLSVCKLFG